MCSVLTLYFSQVFVFATLSLDWKNTCLFQCNHRSQKNGKELTKEEEEKKKKCTFLSFSVKKAAILKICGLDVLMLHASMQQRQRLKNLDRFKVEEEKASVSVVLKMCFSKTRSHSILLATDVAARGLDIPNVAHVLHFDVPRNAEL